jgi:hypothetical protein
MLSVLLVLGFSAGGSAADAGNACCASIGCRILFLREKDWKYGAISFGVLTILLLGAVFGVGEH